MGFLLRLESVASPETPQEAIATLVGFARKFGIGVIANINGRDAFAFPGTPVDEAVRNWERDMLTTAAGQRAKRTGASRSASDPKPLIERLADEVAWWMNWANDAESVPRRSFEKARRDGTALLRELDPRRVGEPPR